LETKLIKGIFRCPKCKLTFEVYRDCGKIRVDYYKDFPPGQEKRICPKCEKRK